MLRLIVAMVLVLAGFIQSGHAGLRHWGFQSPFGTYNQSEIRMGLAVYQADCARCHGLDMVPYRDFETLRLGPKRLASIIATINHEQAFDVEAEPWVDRVRRASPPDLSLIEQGHRNGPGYVYALLTGYRPKPAAMRLRPDHYFDIGFPGEQITMPPALEPGSVTMADGRRPGVREMAHDVAAFLAWTAHPDLDDRKAVGGDMVICLLVLGIVGGRLVLARRRITDKQI